MSCTPVIQAERPSPAPVPLPFQPLPTGKTYTVDQVRQIPEANTSMEVLVAAHGFAATAKYTFDSSSTAADDGVNVLRPNWRTVDEAGRWLKEQLSPAGSTSPLTTKADLYTRTASADARLAGGVDRAVPIYKAAAATGLETRKLRQADKSYEGHTGHSFVDHFDAGTFAGETGWTSDNSGAGAIVTVNSLGLADGNHHGIAEFDTGTTSTGQASLHKGTRTIRLGGGRKIIEIKVRIEDLSTLAQEFDIYLGLSNRKDTSNNFVGFVYDRNVSVNWLARTVDNGAPTTTDTLVPVAADVWVTLRIEINAAGTEVKFYIDGALVHAEVATIPTAAGREVGPRLVIVKSASTVNRLMYVDLYGLEDEYTTDS